MQEVQREVRDLTSQVPATPSRDPQTPLMPATLVSPEGPARPAHWHCTLNAFLIHQISADLRRVCKPESSLSAGH